MREQADEHRFAGAVRPEDRGVFTFANGEREAVEHGPAVLHDGGVVNSSSGGADTRNDRTPGPAGARVGPTFG